LPQYAVERTVHRLGRLPAGDPRDQQYSMRQAMHLLATPTQPRPSRYWIAPKPLDQGDTNTCVGHAWKHYLLAQPFLTKIGPSAFDIYHQAQKVDEWPGEEPLYYGTSVRAGAKVLSSTMMDAAGKRYSAAVTQYLWSKTIDDTVRWISEHSGVVVGTNWYDGMFDPDKDGMVHISGNVAGGHAYYLLGYSLTRKAFRGLNSWGSGWAQGGRFWISFADMERLLKEDGEFCCATEQRVIASAT
jgi:hypothetical protein